MGDEERGDESRLHPQAWGRAAPRSPPHRQGPRLSRTLQSRSPFCLRLTQSPNFIILKLYKYLTKPFTGFKETLVPFGWMFLLFVFFSFQTFYFIFGYNWLTIWQFQVDSKGTQSYIHRYPFSPKLPSRPGCHIPLSRVPVLQSRPPLVNYFKYSTVYTTIPNSLTIPSPIHPPRQSQISSLLFCKLVQMFRQRKTQQKRCTWPFSLSVDASKQSHCWTWLTVLISSKGLKPNNTYDELTWSMPPIQKNSLHSWGLQAKKKFHNFNSVGNFGS